MAVDSGGSVQQVPDNQVAPVIGDYDGDGCVTYADSTPLIQAIGLTVPPADGVYDIDGNGVIDFNDYIAWTSNLGNGCGGGSTAR